MLRPRARVPSAPPLLPAPRRHVLGDDVHRIRAGTPLVLARGTGFDDDASAQRLRDGLAERTGVHLAIESHADPSALGPHIALEIDPSIGVIDSPSLRAQAYRIDVDAARIRVRGGGRAGLRHGCETLLQLVDARGRVAGCRIDDHPDFALRGVMLDVSRGKVPKPASIEALIDLCARLKLNVLMLYTEHTYRFRRHPEIGRDDDPLLDAETMRRSMPTRRVHVELVPCLQSLGHMEHVLKLPAYAARSPRPTWAGRSRRRRTGTYPLLADLYAEYLPNFRSPWFNANCDEPWDLGRGQSAAAAEALGPGGLYLDHVQKIKRLAAQHGKRTMIWGDVVHAHPERIPEIDRGITLLDWWYEAEFDYDRAARLSAQRGLEFMACPGTSSWNCLFPRIANSQANISGWADAGRRHGALGLINTDWGDHGHYNLQGHSATSRTRGGRSRAGRARRRKRLRPRVLAAALRRLQAARWPASTARSARCMRRASRSSTVPPSSTCSSTTSSARTSSPRVARRRCGARRRGSSASCVRRSKRCRARQASTIR